MFQKKSRLEIPEIYVLRIKLLSIYAFLFFLFKMGRINDVFEPGTRHYIWRQGFWDAIQWTSWQRFYFERVNRIRLYIIRWIWRTLLRWLFLLGQKSLVAPPSLLSGGTDGEVVRGADESARTEERDFLAVPMEFRSCCYGWLERWDRGAKLGLAITCESQPNGIYSSCVFLFGEESLAGLVDSSW